MNAAWKFRGGATASVGSVTAVEFDPDVELLWVCDSYGMLMSFTAQTHVEAPVWTTYSSFSACHRPVSSVFFLALGSEKMVTLADRNVIRGFKRGGVPVMCLPLPADSQAYVDLFQANAKTGAMFFTGNVGLTRLQLHEGTAVHRTIATDDSATVVMRQCERWVATGNTAGTVVVRNAADLASIGHVSVSRNRVLALDVFDDTVLVAASERSATSFVKVYDVRKLGEAVATISNVRSGNITQMRRYQDSFGLSHDRAFLLTPQGFHIIQLDQEQPVFSSTTMSEGSCTAVSVSPSGMCAAIGNNKGYFFALAHPATRDDYVMSTYKQPVRPQHPTFAQSWVEASPGDGFDYCCDYGCSHGGGATAAGGGGGGGGVSANNVRNDGDDNDGGNGDGGDDDDDDDDDDAHNGHGNGAAAMTAAKRRDGGAAAATTAAAAAGATPAPRLASSWPEVDYMILTVPQKLRCLNAESNTVVHNQWGLVRGDSYVPDPKDVLSAALPNPYPYNTQLGTDPTRVQEVLLALRKDMRRRHKNARLVGSGGEYAVLEDALQVCYGMQHKIDWKSYNEIPHKVVGLDNSFPECWIASLLQALYLCQPPEYPIRRVVLRHLCRREYCLTCEMAFIFANMMTIATSALGLKESALPPITQMAHLIRTMHQLRVFANAGVFERPRSRDDAVAKMHMTLRLILDRLHKDLQDQAAYPLLTYQPPSSDYANSIAALFGTEFSSNGRVHVEPRFFWEVPASALKVDEGLQHLLKQLEAYKDQVQIQRLPPIIVLLLNPEHGNLKPPTSLKISRAGKEDYNYILNSSVIHLADDVDDSGNFVSYQRIKDESFALINDYRVTAPMKTHELERFLPALRSHSAVVAFYALDQLVAPPYARNDDNRPPNLWHTLGPLLKNDVLSRALQRDPARQQFVSPLTAYTDIKAGDLVAIDAEYVVLRWRGKDATELCGGGGGVTPLTGASTMTMSSGTGAVAGSAAAAAVSGNCGGGGGAVAPVTGGIVAGMHTTTHPRKPHMGLARVSCILSSEDGDERTIVDDYVHTPEAIEDYVTQYSGIHPGDLDPQQSTRSLTSLKATYLKLRALVDAGVVFVGHGLAQDFRVCNIAVPKRQIIDTLELYHKPGARYLSLRFLAYHVLGESVQESEHDSIEDARTSLRLYRRYVQLQKEGTFESVLDHLLAKGAETSWYVPDHRPTFCDTLYTSPGSLMGSPVFRVRDGSGNSSVAASSSVATTSATTSTITTNNNNNNNNKATPPPPPTTTPQQTHAKLSSPPTSSSSAAAASPSSASVAAASGGDCTTTTRRDGVAMGGGGGGGGSGADKHDGLDVALARQRYVDDT